NVVDTQELQKRNIEFDALVNACLFGYGTLIYNTGFPLIHRRPAYTKGWQRKFWQGSHDHRGTMAQPGRVVTLIEEDNVECHGVAYLISREVFAYLDHRERNGYLRFSTPLYFTEKGESTDKALVYVATQANAAYLGT